MSRIILGARNQPAWIIHTAHQREADNVSLSLSLSV